MIGRSMDALRSQIAAIIVAFAAPGGSVAAQETNSLFAYGGLACDDWSRPANFANAALKLWLIDYVNHLGHDASYRLDPLAQTSPEEIVEWVNLFCRNHPLTGLEVAGISMMNDLASPSGSAH
jgi:hypothetical protein